MKKRLPTLLLILAAALCTGQNTVGLLSYDPALTAEGYLLLYPDYQSDVFLLDNCGRIVHRWEGTPDTAPGQSAYLLPDGRLVKTARTLGSNDPIWSGGAGGLIEIRTWENELEWSYVLNDANSRQHHDIEITPQGTVLMIAWEQKNYVEAVEAGRDPAEIDDGKLWPDWVLEVDPATDEVIWEWHAWDHLIQDFDASKNNFGNVEEHPELIDINYDLTGGKKDWMHTNSIDYNPTLDQIALSVPFFNEIWIIDHSTTTAEAASHEGGNSGKGGDLLYRWGNPQAYRAGTWPDRKLFNQHDVHWIGDFLENSHPHFGKLAVFNNMAGPDFSTVSVLAPAWDEQSMSYSLSANAWEPADFDLTLTHPAPTEMYSTGLSSVQFLANENVLVCSGRQGYNFEMTTDGEVVWEYVTPLNFGGAVLQGTMLDLNDNLTFRIRRFPVNFPAFDGKDLSPQGWLELEPDSIFCSNLLNPVSEKMEEDLQFQVFPNPAIDQLVIDWQGAGSIDVGIFDLWGRQVWRSKQLSGQKKLLDISLLENGLYFVCVDGFAKQKLVVK